MSANLQFGIQVLEEHVNGLNNQRQQQEIENETYIQIIYEWLDEMIYTRLIVNTLSYVRCNIYSCFRNS